VPIHHVGPVCARRGCGRPVWKAPLCAYCWRLARFLDKDPEMFAYVPLHGYDGDRDAVELPWELWEDRSGGRDGSVADLFAVAPVERRPGPECGAS
jgi:hypothetical protein